MCDDCVNRVQTNVGAEEGSGGNDEDADHNDGDADDDDLLEDENDGEGEGDGEGESDGGSDGGGDDDGDNQVVPWSSTTPPPAASSPCSDESAIRLHFGGKRGPVRTWSSSERKCEGSTGRESQVCSSSGPCPSPTSATQKSTFPNTVTL